MTTVIVNKNDNLFRHRLSTDCERPIHPLPAPLLLPNYRSALCSRSIVYCHDRSIRFSARSAHMLCMRASHDENSAKTNKTSVKTSIQLLHGGTSLLRWRNNTK